jgi:hypothetical protein
MHINQLCFLTTLKASPLLVKHRCDASLTTPCELSVWLQHCQEVLGDQLKVFA